jgi:CheY-like chemotaxis protein
LISPVIAPDYSDRLKNCHPNADNNYICLIKEDSVVYLIRKGMSIMPRILFVDDNRDFLEIASLALNKVGYDVITAADGDDAINKYKESSFDVVVTDLMMPGVTGYELARHVRETSNGSKPIIIGISGTSNIIDTSCFDVILQKPFFLKKLIERIKDLESNRY